MIRLARQFSSAQLAQRTVNVVGGVEYKCDSITNVPSRILEKIDCKLYCVPKNPIHTIRLLIEQHFKKSSSQFQFKTIDSPAVSIQNNFDLLLIPKDHVSRSPHDTYYLNSDHVLRTQTSAHQVQLLREGNLKFLLTADVYRRDEIDSSHYPVFHQMEGVNVVAKNSLTTNLNHKGYHPTPENPIQIAHSNKEDILLVDNLLFDLRKSLEEMVESLFSKEIKVRWVPAYFPFTSNKSNNDMN